MAKKHTWTNNTNTGYLNDELDRILWTDEDSQTITSTLGNASITFDPGGSSNRLRLDADGKQADISLFVYSNGNAPSFVGVRYAGSEASPSALSSGDVSFRLIGWGYDGTAIGQLAKMTVTAAENMTTGAHGGTVTFTTATIGGTAMVDRMVISSAGITGSVPFIYAADPSSANELTRKSYVDAAVAAASSLRPSVDVPVLDNKGGLTTSNNGQVVWVEYPDAATDNAYWTVTIPDEWSTDGGTVYVHAFFSASVNTGNAYMVFRLSPLAVGSSITPTVTNVSQAVAVPGTVGNVGEFDSSSTGLSVSGIDALGINVRRLGTDAADTAAGTVYLHALKIVYVPA